MFRSSFGWREAQPFALERIALYRSTVVTRWCPRYTASDELRPSSNSPMVCSTIHTQGKADMAHRINIVVQDDIWGLLQRIPQGDRSRTINLVLREWASKRRRLDAAAEMDRLRKSATIPAVSTEEIVRWIREDRDGGH